MLGPGRLLTHPFPLPLPNDRLFRTGQVLIRTNIGEQALLQLLRDTLETHLLDISLSSCN